ncbi:dynamin family protein [Gloeocapsa sp. PCC 73106]|uniref:dynamin family protein n=1 Tax=Gloeocapsa sp. PCC 73106 TaxID=102232 RepID=UPI001181A571|nr:dynamin family protein [Gloeocapsa sp. PCC 73106]
MKHVLIPESQKWLRSDVKTSLRVETPYQQPTDLTERIGPWLRQSFKLVESSKLENMVATLQALETHSYLPSFQLAMVGEFNRGKSTLINRLLGRSLVPVGKLSTTAIITSITAGVEESMKVRFSQEQSEVRSLQESSWNDLLETGEKVVRVELTIDNPWLRSLDINLIDTPGIGNLYEHHTSLVFDLLSRCDAAILVVSAMSPFGMVEETFIKQEMIARHIDRILIVVSYLDTFTLENRARLLAHIRERVLKISDKITILPLHPVDNTTEEVVLDTLRTQITAMVSQGDRRAWRSQQVAGQLADYLSQIGKIGEEAIATARMNPVERDKALQQVRAEVQKAENRWLEIRSELDKRCQQCYQLLKEKIISSKTDLLDTLSFELSRTANPKIWWERELPFRLRREFPSISRKSRDLFMKLIARDFTWLQNEVSQSFGIKMTSTTANSLASTTESLDMGYDPNQLEMTDLQKFRLPAFDYFLLEFAQAKWNIVLFITDIWEIWDEVDFGITLPGYLQITDAQGNQILSYADGFPQRLEFIVTNEIRLVTIELAGQKIIQPLI